jgi:hypothetical protein
MIERLFVAILIGLLVIGLYLLLNYWQRRAAVADQQMAKPGQVKMLYFYSEHCGACQAQGHYLAQLDDLHRTLIEPVDGEQSPELARLYNIFTLPTTILIDRQGSVRYINPGLTHTLKLTRQLENVIKL